MNMTLRSGAPAAVLAGGLILVGRVDDQRVTPLRRPLSEALPTELDGFREVDIEIPAGEQLVAGMSSYVMRAYAPAGVESAPAAFTLYVGYYESQTQGKTIHSPRNCLPRAGWEAIAFRTAPIVAGGALATVNRYLIQNGERRALVLYWYQGRGRVESNEYRVKWDLLRDAALRGRSEEALVRVVVPVDHSEEDAFEQAAAVARTVIPAVHAALPEGWN